MTNESKVMIRATAPESYRRAFVTTKHKARHSNARSPETQGSPGKSTLAEIRYQSHCTKASSKSKLHWELQGASAAWDDKDLSAFLESNKWIVLKIHKRRKGYRKSWTWTF